MGGCLSENTIQELVAGALSGDAHARARRHIEICTACRTLVVQLAHDDDLDAQQLVRAVAMDVLAVHALPARFECVRLLGRGGMGTVFEALDRERGTRVALKTLQQVSADGLLRFKTEFRAMQDVHHPNLVVLGELLEERGQWWLTMELVEGAGFVRHVRPDGKLDERRLRAALRQLAAGLSALHAHGLVHRDVKPHNVLVTPAGRVVLLDFGLVAFVAQSESNVVGTAAYMAPEQGLLREIGPAADWYAVGALLYEALVGTLPFTGTPLQVLILKQHELPRRPAELGDVPDDLDQLCMQLLAIEPAARMAAAAALAKLDPGESSPSPPAALGSSAMFVGRDRELASLADAFDETRKGTEAVVLIEGESGIGKSALVSHYLDELHRRDPAVRVLAGRCYERETVPYKGIDGAIDALARTLRKLPEVEVATVLPRRAGLLLHAFPVLGKVAALRALPADTMTDPKELRSRAFTALRELLGRLAERGPLVMWIDDLQWADGDSLELLASIMARPDAPLLLLVLTCRPPGDAHGSSIEAAISRVSELLRVRRMTLSPLTRDEAVALAERLLVDVPSASPRLAGRIADEAAGHPLFIDALARHSAVRSASDPAPRLSDALWARITEIDPSARRLLALVSVAGWPVSREILVAAGALTPGEVDAALVHLRRAHLIRALDRVDQGVEPQHDRIREAVLDHLDPGLRKDCHRELAHALLTTTAPTGALAAAHDDPETPADLPTTTSPRAAHASEAIAAHLHAAGELEEAFRYKVLAADEATAALAFDRAARLYREALAIQREPEAGAVPRHETRDLLGRLARALENACRGRESAAVFFELANLAAAGSEDAIEFQLWGAKQLLRSGYQSDGRRALVAVLDALNLRRSTTRLGMVWRLLWRRARLRICGFQTPTSRTSVGMSRREHLRLEACLVAWMLPDLVIEFATRYQVLTLTAADPKYIGFSLSAEVNFAVIRGGAASRRTARLMAELSAVAARTGHPYFLAQEDGLRAGIALALGQWARGRELAMRAMHMFRDRCVGASFEVSLMAVQYLMALYYMGEIRELLREVPPLLRAVEERGEQFAFATFQAVSTGKLWLVRGEPAIARQQIDLAAARWGRAEFGVWWFSGQIALAEVELYEGAAAAAYRRVDSAWRAHKGLLIWRTAVVRARALALRGVAALAACQSDSLDRRLLRVTRRDARELRAMGMPWTSGLARLLDAGAALVVGDRGSAAQQFARADTELASAGMIVHAAVARRRRGELTAGRDGARGVSEVDALLAAQGVREPGRFARLYAPEIK